MRALTQSEARGTETNVYRGGMLAANGRVYAGGTMEANVQSRKRAGIRTLRLLWVPFIAALIYTTYFYAVEAPRREPEMRDLLARITPPAGALQQKSEGASLPALIRMKSVYEGPFPLPDLKQRFDETMRSQGWSLVADEVMPESAWQILSYRRGEYRARLELPPEYSGRLDLRYPYSVTLMWPTIGLP